MENKGKLRLRWAAELLTNIFARQRTEFESAVLTRDEVAAAQDLARAWLDANPRAVPPSSPRSEE